MGKIVAQALTGPELPQEQAQESVKLLKILVAHQNWFEALPAKKKYAASILKTWLKDPEIQEYLRINRYEGVLWFNREAFDKFTRGLLTVALISTTSDTELSDQEISSRTLRCYKIIHHIRKASIKSGYQVEKLLDSVN